MGNWKSGLNIGCKSECQAKMNNASHEREALQITQLPDYSFTQSFWLLLRQLDLGALQLLLHAGYILLVDISRD